MIIPTGIGAAIGGYAGDATPQLNLLASVTDVLITHPNVANAAVFQKLPDNALYVEGYGLDQFMRGRWGLAPVRANRIGVVLDVGAPEDMRILHLNTLNAVKTVYGLDIVGVAETTEPVAVDIEMTASGCSSGVLRNPQVILKACRQLIDHGATAIALCIRLPEPPEASELEADYRHGQGVDPIGGIEGILSHLVVSELGIPCAHAPIFDWEQAAPERQTIVDPRAAAEYITPTFLPCVLTGLHRAPQFYPLPKPNPNRNSTDRKSEESSETQSAQLPATGTWFTVDDLSALVVPADALGGSPVLSALSKGISVITVTENTTVLSVTTATLTGLPPERRALIRAVRSYEEAAGTLQAMRLGLNVSAGRQPAPVLVSERKSLPTA